MEFRWLVFLTLWTAFAGPVLARPNRPQVSDHAVVATERIDGHKSPR